MIKKHLETILILSGCFIILIAISLKLYTRYEQKLIINNYRASVQAITNNQDKFVTKQKNTSGKTEDQQSENQDITNDKSEGKNKKVKAKIVSGDIIGILTIPKIDLCVGIGEGVDMKTLKYTVGHFADTALPGEEGNLCIIGHRSYSYGEFFNRLDEMEIDDEIIVESSGNIYKYKVTEITVVKPEEISVLDQTKDAEITLITCTPIRVGTHRLIVKGALVKE